MGTNEKFEFRGINHLALVCRDMKVTVDFYTGVLGMPLTKTVVLPGGMGQHFFSLIVVAMTNWLFFGLKVPLSLSLVLLMPVLLSEQGT